MGNFWGVSLLLKLVSVKYFLLVVVLRLVKKKRSNYGNKVNSFWFFVK